MMARFDSLLAGARFVYPGDRMVTTVVRVLPPCGDAANVHVETTRGVWCVARVVEVEKQ